MQIGKALVRSKISSELDFEWAGMRVEFSIWRYMGVFKLSSPPTQCEARIELKVIWASSLWIVRAPGVVGPASPLLLMENTARSGQSERGPGFVGVNYRKVHSTHNSHELPQHSKRTRRRRANSSSSLVFLRPKRKTL